MALVLELRCEAEFWQVLDHLLLIRGSFLKFRTARSDLSSSLEGGAATLETLGTATASNAASQILAIATESRTLVMVFVILVTTGIMCVP